MIDANGNFIPDNSALFNTMPMAPPMPQQPQQPEGPGFFDRLGTGIKGAWNSGIDMMSNSMNDPRYPPGVSPLAGGLAGLAQGFGQAAMPSRMPVPFGAALGMAAGGMQQGVNDSNRSMALYQQAQGQDIQNQAARSALPVQIATNKMAEKFLNNPDLINQLLQAAGNVPGSQQMSAAPQLGGLQAGGQPAGVLPIGDKSSGGKQGNPVSSAFDSIQDVSARRMALNAAISSGMSAAEIPAWIATVHPESGWNLKVADNKNPNGTYDMGVGQINSTHIGEGGMTEQQLRDPQNNLNKSAQIFHSSWVNSQGDPAKAIGGYNPGAGPEYTTKRMNLLAEYHGGVPGGMLSPEEAMQQSREYERRANMGAMFGGFPGIPKLFGDPAENRKTAETFRNYALAGGMAYNKSQGELPAQTQLEQTKTQLSLNADLTKQSHQKGLDVAAAPVLEQAKVGNRVDTDRFGNMYRTVDGVTTYLGRGSEVKPVWSAEKQQMVYADVGGVGVGAQTPGVPGNQPGAQSGAPPGPQAMHPSPIAEHFMEGYGGDLSKQFEETDNKASSAVANNFLFDNLRRDSQTWQMGKFANIEGNARAWLSAAAHSVGVPQDNPTFKSLVDTPLADYQAFIKSSGSLLRTAVHETSPRASTQEYNMIEHTLPSPTSSAQAFSQVADQWQGINDYQIAKQTMQHGYLNHPQDFNTDFNANVMPHAFMLNRMAQSPQGQQDMDRMLRSMQETAEGRSTAANMLKGYEFAKAHNLFQNLPPSMAQPPAQ